MTADAGQEGPLDLAARRLDRALAMLGQRLASRSAQAGADASAERDRAALAAQLDAAKARERELEEAAAAANSALSRAISEIRAALGEPATEDAEA